MKDQIKILLELTIKELVDSPDQVVVEVKEGDAATIFSVKTNKSDMGKVIGKKGRNIHALRTLLISIAAKNKIRAELELVD